MTITLSSNITKLCDVELGPFAPPSDCPEADADIEVLFVEGVLTLRVTVNSNTPFPVGEIAWSIDGTPQTPVEVDGTPAIYDLGAVEPGDEIIVILTNPDDPECNDVRPLFSVQGPCAIAAGTEGCDYFSFDYNLNGDWSDWGIEVDRTTLPTTDYWTVLLPDGTPLVLEPGVDQFLPSEEDTQEGTYCVYVSDENGNPVAGRWNGIYIFGRTDTSLDVTISNLDVSRVEALAGAIDFGIQVQGADLSSGLDLTHITTLENAAFDYCVIGAEEVLVNGIPAMRSFALVGCQATKANTLTNVPLLEQYLFTDSQLPSSEVDRVLNEIAASSTVTDGTISLENQTPAAPRTSASDAAVTDLEGRSPGWTLTLDT